MAEFQTNMESDKCICMLVISLCAHKVSMYTHTRKDKTFPFHCPQRESDYSLRTWAIFCIFQVRWKYTFSKNREQFRWMNGWYQSKMWTQWYKRRIFLAVGAEPHSQMLGNGTFAVVMTFSDINGCCFNFFAHIAYWEQTPSCMLT